LDWLVDPRLGGDGGMSWSASHEAFWMKLIGGIEYLLALFENGLAVFARLGLFPFHFQKPTRL
jgi:hypothetical protein